MQLKNNMKIWRVIIVLQNKLDVPTNLLVYYYQIVRGKEGSISYCICHNDGLYKQNDLESIYSIWHEGYNIYIQQTTTIYFISFYLFERLTFKPLSLYVGLYMHFQYSECAHNGLLQEMVDA